MLELIIGITIFVTFPAAYIITTENVKMRSIFKRKKLWAIEAEIKHVLSPEDKIDLLNIVYFLKFGDLYFSSLRYIDSLKHYKRILNIISMGFFRNSGFKNVFENIYIEVIKRMQVCVAEFKKHEKRKKIKDKIF